jgi:GTP diphosphokinase / guanosine-3',5'-bis(diphosphate) 3'-diphosphatase
MATVDRVLPWRRQTSPTDELLAPLLHAYRSRHPKASTALIVRAYEAADRAHRNQYRSSMERYITHPLAVAKVVADLGLDEATIAAALLHDAVEDSELTVADVEAEFGAEIASFVDGVTKLDRLHFDSQEDQQSATMRKMLVAMARDPRVLIIKLCDRLHNLRTIAAMREDKQRRIAQETLQIYAPLAHRLGMQLVRQELEDLAFAALHPKQYAALDHQIAVRSGERDVYLAKVVEQITAQLSELKISAQVSGRPKHLHSVHEKMKVKNRAFEEIFDLVGIRVVVDSSKDCYASLGAIHGMWAPVQGRFKDYIANPKFNNYQSLHTTVIGPEGRVVEVQIRTQTMHLTAERGVAAHWSYKEGASSEDLAWIARMADWQREIDDPALFMETLRSDLEQDEVYVFTPKGRLITLPTGSTPIDFAYAVHTQVGHSCIGARVNGRLVPLEFKLTSGNTCEIFTSKLEGAGPKQDWLRIVASPRAKNKIRQWFSRERRDDSIDAGKEALRDALRREDLPISRILGSEMLAKLAADSGHASIEGLYAAIGEHHLNAGSFAARIRRALEEGAAPSQDPDDTGVLMLPTSRSRTPQGVSRRRQRVGVHVEGLDDTLVHLSKCCTPIPGDEIMGFVTKGRGVSVHRTDCANAESLTQNAGRLIEVEWDASVNDVAYTAKIEVQCFDRSWLLRDVANALSEVNINITASSTVTRRDGVTMMFELEVADPGHVEEALRLVRLISDVYEARRVWERKTGPRIGAEEFSPS